MGHGNTHKVFSDCALAAGVVVVLANMGVELLPWIPVFIYASLS